MAAFTFIILSFYLTGCEDIGNVGGGLVEERDNVVTESIDVLNIEVIENDGFTGVLPNTALGKYDDPVFGELNAITLIKPSVANLTIRVDEISAEDNLSLRLIFRDEVYGNSGSVGRYDVYEAGEIWRGNELLTNKEVDIDRTNKIGQFQTVSGVDTVVVQLSQSWQSKYREFFNSNAPNRDSLYATTFPGLAIVPSDDNQKIEFINNAFSSQPEPGEDLPVTTSLVLNRPDDDFDLQIPLLDWGFTLTRENELESNDTYMLHSTIERVLKVTVDMDPDDFIQKSISSAQLIFNVNTELQNQGNVNRPIVQNIRSHVFPVDQIDVLDAIFLTQAAFVTSLVEPQNFYQLNITDFILNQLFNDNDTSVLYISPETSNGVLFSVPLYNLSASEDKRPKLIITSVKGE